MNLTIFRREQMQSLQLTAEQKQGAAMKLEVDDKATSSQRALRKAWLAAPVVK